MKRLHHKSGALTIVVLALLLGLLAAAAPAWAGTTVNHVQGMVTGNPYFSSMVVEPDGTLHFYDWVGTAVFYRATGPDGWRFLGGGAICIQSWIPPKGDNRHEGIVVFTKDPVDNNPANWSPSMSFSYHVTAASPTWTGTWSGITHNKHNHQAVMDVTGVAGTDNANYTAHIEVMSMQFDVANWHSGQYIVTPFNLRALVTSP